MNNSLFELFNDVRHGKKRINNIHTNRASYSSSYKVFEVSMDSVTLFYSAMFYVIPYSAIEHVEIYK